MSTLVFVNPEISNQADGDQSSRVPVPLPEDPYEAYLDGTDTESEPFEDPVETKTPKLPYTVAPPTSLPDSTPPTLVPILRRTERMAVCVPPAMSPGLSASMAGVAAMSESSFRKRFRSSYESSLSSSPPDLHSRKHYRGTPELVEDDDEEEYGYIKNHKKTVKSGQARTRESEEYKANARKVKPQSKSAKKNQSQSKMVKLSQTQKDKSSKCFTLAPQFSQKSKNVPSSLIGP
ncbi:hypothetical protein Tco_1492462 [Tanacetum coccineum]